MVIENLVSIAFEAGGFFVGQVTVSRIPYGDTELISFASLAAQDHSEKPYEQRLRSLSQVRRKCQDIFDWSVQQKGAIGKNKRARRT